METKSETIINPDTETGRGSDVIDLSEKDEAIAMVGEQEHELDAVVVARTVRKIDWFLLPVMVFGCECPHFRSTSAPAQLSCKGTFGG